MDQVIVRGVGTATPPYSLPQSEAKAFASTMFRDAIHDLERLLTVFKNTQIECRALAQPLSWYGKPHTFQEANKIYTEVALDISVKAAQRAIDHAGVNPANIAAVLFVSSTGVATPSLDSPMIQKLGIPHHAQRLPIWGLGCAGGVSGLARAQQIARTLPNKPVLLVATELCTLTFQANDMTKANLVATSLFGDGAGAVIVECQTESNTKDQPALQLLKAHSTLFPETEYVMGWDLIDSGLQVRFDKTIPSLVMEHLPALFKKACIEWDVSSDDVKHFVTHPGGARVLTAYAESLGLPAEQFRHAHDILRRYGNMSSPTVFFVLQEYLNEVGPTDELGVMLAWGPGFSAEQLLFRW